MSDDTDLQAFLDSGGQKPAPVVQAGNLQTFLDSGGSSPHPVPDTPKEPSLFDRYVGFQEGQLAGATGGIGKLAGGLTYLGSLAAGGDSDAASKVQADTEKALTYQPRTELGKQTAADMGNAASYLGQKEAETAGPAVTDWATRGGATPEVAGAMGATANTLIQAPQYLVPWAGKLKGAPEAAAAVRSEPYIDTPASSTAPATAPPLSASGAPRAGYWEPPAEASPAAGGPSPVAAAVQFPEAAPIAKPGATLSDAEQAQRQAILQRVGVPETRQSAIQGDASTASNDYQESKLTSPNGLRMKQVIDNERGALEDHADSIVQDTGGIEGSAKDEAVKLERGQTFLKPLDDLTDYFNKGIKTLYNTADERAAGVSGQFPGFKDALNDDSSLTNSDRVHLQSAALAYGKKLGIVDDDGNFSGTVAQAETMRKYLNESWSPQNSGFVGKLKDALDDDVTKAAGDDVYSSARALRSQRGATLDDPNGIAKILDSSGPAGINRAVPVEKVMDTVSTMPVAQLTHIMTTLRNLPPELQPEGQAAIESLQAHVASKIADAGKSTQSMWNAKGVTQALRTNSARIPLIFQDKPAVLSKLGDLNDAGNILKKDQSYPGAAVQEANLVRSGAMGAMRLGGSAVGGLTGTALAGPPGTVVGSALGGYLANKGATALESRALMKNVESRIVKIPPQSP